MSFMKKILIPVDGSNSSLEALSYIVYLADEFDIIVYLMTVIEPRHCIYNVYAEPITLTHQVSDVVKVLNQRLGETKKKAEEMGFADTKLVTRFGTPHKKIVEIAKEEGIDLIVMGTHGRKGIAHFLMGSVTEKVIREAPCPVTVIRENIHELIDNTIKPFMKTEKKLHLGASFCKVPPFAFKVAK